MSTKIYLDNAATTCIDDRVVKEMLPFYNKRYGNPSSMHSFGVDAKRIIEESKARITQYLGVLPSELVFTSSGTEANNLAIKGVAFANQKKGNHIIVSAIEHDCVLNSSNWLTKLGFRTTFLPVDSDGIVNLDELEKSITKDTVLVSIMHANNEIGTIQPIEQIGEICKRNNVLFHSDACQSFGKIPLNVIEANVDLLTINAHKIYGPKGIGALYVRNGVLIDPIMHGGGQEFGLRSSTENVPAIVGFSKAVELCYSEMSQECERVSELRQHLITFLYSNFDNVYIIGSESKRLPGHLSFSFHNLEGESIRLLFLLDENGIAVSAGSACSSNHSGSASHVLQAIGLNPLQARGSIRVSLGRYNSKDEIIAFQEALKKCTVKLNSIFSI